MKNIILIVFLFSGCLIKAQSSETYSCGTDQVELNSILEDENVKSSCTQSSDAFMSKYRLQTHYIPNSSSYQGVKTIPINIIVYLEDDATYFPFQVSGSTASYYDKDGNLTSGFSTTSSQMINYEDWMNRAYAHTQPANGIGWVNGVLVNTTPQYPSYLPDSKIRFVIKHYYFYESSTLLNGNSYTNETNKIAYHLSINPDAANQINCILAEHVPQYGAAGYAGSYFFNGNHTLYISTGLDCHNWQSDYFYTENHLSHEFGHHIMLRHTYNSETLDPSNIDYLDDVFPYPPFYFIGDNVMGGSSPNDFISPKQMGRIHRTLSLNFTRNFAYGYSSVPHEITSNETWDFTFKSYNDIVVKNGAVLTLTCRLEMVPEAKIIVEPGAKLILDGGIITSARCGGPEHEGYWQGIEVWGDRTQSQIPHTNGLSDYQGEIEIINGGTVENAINAISTIKYNSDGSKDWSKTGGIITLNDAILKNNNFDVWIGGYHNFLPANNKEIRNYSSIINSHFENNDNMLSGYNGYAFVGLWDVGTIMIKGNSFKNLKTDQNTMDKGRGIIAFSATLSLSDYCPSTGTSYVSLSQSQATSITPCTDAVRNHFEGLYYGISATNVTGLPNSIVHIDRAEFENVYHSIYIDNGNYSSITRCDFNIASTDPAATNNSNLYDAYGIYMDGSDGYRVEENDLSKYAAQQGIRGIIVNNSMDNNNEIYKNILTTTGYAIQTQQDNRGSKSGLGIYCNTMSGSYNDIVVLDQGIAEHQKIITLDANSAQIESAAGNIFTTCNNNNYQNYYNGSSGNIIYYPDVNNVPQCVYNVDFPPSNITPLSQACPSKLASPLSTTLQKLSSAKLALNSAETILYIWKDGGNANLENEVETTEPWDVFIQFNSLLAESPYLSDEVLLATINNPSFSSLMIKLIMVANPQSTHNNKIMDAIYDRIPALPQSYIDEIEAGESTISQLELLEADVAANLHNVDIYTNDAKRIYQMDYEDGEDISNYITFMASINSIESEYELAALYLENGDYTSMTATLNAISSTYQLDDQQTIDLANWQIYFNIAKIVRESVIRQNVLTETQISQLDAIASLDNSPVSASARALLIFNNPEFVYVEVVEPVETSGARIGIPKQGTVISANVETLKVYPNPSQDYITLEYRTGEKYNKVWFEITDATGKVVFTKQLQGGNKDELINISELASGTYSLLFYGDNEVIEVKKINILK